MMEINNYSFRSIEEVKSWLDERNTEYRNGNTTVSDKDYDVIWEYYKEQTGEQLHDGEVKFIKIENNKREENPIPMAGLDKITSIEGVIKWVEKNNLFGKTLVCTPKYDGVSCGIDNEKQNYDIDKHVNAYIKGDEGSYPIWNHYHHINSGSKNPKFDGNFHVGEIIIANSIFEKKYSDKFKNVRNFTAGRLNPNSQSTQELMDFVYLRYNLESGNKGMNKIEMLAYLNNFNPHEIPHETLVIENSSVNKESLEKLLNALYKQWNNKFTIDGVVIDVNDYDIRQSLGRNTVGNPKYAIAYKGEFGDIKRVPIKSINYSLDKDGTLNPSVTTELVMLDGAECGKNIFVDNIKYLRDNGIYEGKIVEIKRGGKIIPRIYNPNFDENEKVKKYEFYSDMIDLGIIPSKCPSCGEKFKFSENSVDVSCKNKNCKEVVFRRVLYFFETIKAKGLADQTISLFVNEKFQFERYFDNDFALDLIAKILYYREETFLKNYAGFGKRKAELIYNSIENAIRDCSLARLMSATNLFKNLGETKLGWFLDYYSINFDTIEKLKIKTWIDQDINCIEGYSDISSKSLIAGIPDFIKFMDYINLKVEDCKSNKIEKMEEICEKKDGLPDLDGQTFCFTGFRNKEMETIIKNCNGKIKDSFSLSITCLVVKEKGLGTVKEEKAEKNGIKICDEIEMREILKMETIIEEMQKEAINKEVQKPLW